MLRKTNVAKYYWAVGLTILLGLTLGFAISVVPEEHQHQNPKGGDRGHKKATVLFHDVESQTRQFISYYRDLHLTPQQEAVKERALNSLPAPCCDKYPMSECCCVCNISRSIWGLSNYLIAKLDYNENQVQDAVKGWLEFTNPQGYGGNACLEDRCPAPFNKDGCGGMKASQIIFQD